MIHITNPLDPDDTPLGSDSAPDVMDVSVCQSDTSAPVRPLGVPLDLEMQLRDWSLVGETCTEYMFSEMGWQLFLDKLIRTVDVSLPPTKENRP